eukprot:1624576-Amphidinium_carterae.1
MVANMRGSDGVLQERLQWRGGSWCNPLCACIARGRDVVALRRCGLDGRKSAVREIVDSWANTAGRLLVSWLTERCGS